MISRDEKRWKITAYIILSIMAVLALLPFILLIMASFTDDTVALMNGYSFFPEKFSMDAYQYILDNSNTFFRAYGITIIVTILGTAVSMILTSMTAYILSKRDMPGVKILNFMIIFTMLFNGGLVPTYISYTTIFHIKDTLFALIVPNLLMNGFNIVLVKNYFENSIPESLYESARIDGAGEMLIFARIVLPLSKPILATVGLLTGIAYWNDWQNGLYYLNDNALYSIQNVLNQINQNIAFLANNSVGVSTADMPTTTIRMAIAVIGILPIILIYPFFQKYFVKGITMGAVKG